MRVILIILLIGGITHAETWRDFRNLNLNEAIPVLKLPAPVSTYTFINVQYDNVDTGWFILNGHFWNSINLKLNKCKAKTEIVDPVKDELLSKPQKSYILEGILGSVVMFGVGILFGKIF